MARASSPNNKGDTDQNELARYSTRPGRLPRTNMMSFLGRRSRRRNGGLLLVALIAGLIGFGGGWLGSYFYKENSPGFLSREVKQEYISNESELIAGIAENVGQSVVSIGAKSQVTNLDVFGFARPSVEESAGTGFIIDASGVIVTNRHVVPTEPSSLTIVVADGTRYNDIKVIGRTSDSSPLDVAFLKINDLGNKKLVPVKLGDSSKVEVGEKVIAIGNALGQFQNTVTSGIISGYGRSVVATDQSGQRAENLSDLFQTDAAINQGNSGGPLVNIDGQVIGLNTAVAGNAENVGFSIPVNNIKGLINSVLKKGKLVQTYLGVAYVPLTPDVAQELGLKINRGAYVIPSRDGQPSVIPDSPAAKAGLREKDIITKVGGVAVNEKNSLVGALSYFQPGDTAKLTIVRGDKTIILTATLAEAPEQ